MHRSKYTNRNDKGDIYHIYPTLPHGQDMTQGQFFKRSLTGLNSEFSFSQTSCPTKAEEPSLSYYLPIAGGRIIGFIPFPRVLVLCEMQSVSSRFELMSPCSSPTTITITLLPERRGRVNIIKRRNQTNMSDATIWNPQTSRNDDLYVNNPVIVI